MKITTIATVNGKTKVTVKSTKSPMDLGDGVNYVGKLTKTQIAAIIAQNKVNC